MAKLGVQNQVECVKTFNISVYVVCIVFRIIEADLQLCDAQSIRSVFGVPRHLYLDLTCVQRRTL